MATFFANELEFRAWLEAHHSSETELIVGYYKVGSKKPSMSWSQSVDQALCFGWIDGVRRTIDDESYCIRFTPRRKNSIWSSINIQKMEVLIAQGLMRPEGLNAYAFRTEEKSSIYSHEKAPEKFSPEFLALFQENAPAWTYFSTQAASYQKVMVHWIMTAKQSKTQMTRLLKTIETSAQGKRVQ